MAWFGKLVGGSIGLLFGGPLGMIAGIAFGHMFDKAGTVEGRTYTSSLDQRQMLFFVGAFSLLGKVASIDGSVSNVERQKVISFIQRLKPAQLQEQPALKIFDTAIESEESLIALLSSLSSLSV